MYDTGRTASRLFLRKQAVRFFQEVNDLDDNWIVENLEGAFNTWNEKLTEIWSLVSETPQQFKGGAIWELAQDINAALQAVGYGLLILFFAISIFRSTANFQGLTGAAVTLPEEIKTAIGEVGFLASIPLWLVTILGSVFITVLSFVMILTVYSRFFRLYMYTALAPVPLSTFAGDLTANTGRTFIKSYLGVCMEGAVIVLACMIFSAFTSGGAPGIVDPDASAVTMVWGYLAETIFNMLVLVGLVKGADRIVKEMLAL